MRLAVLLLTCLAKAEIIYASMGATAKVKPSSSQMIAKLLLSFNPEAAFSPVKAGTYFLVDNPVSGSPSTLSAIRPAALARVRTSPCTASVVVNADYRLAGAFSLAGLLTLVVPLQTGALLLLFGSFLAWKTSQEYPASFRSILDADAVADAAVDAEAELRVRCQCKRCDFKVKTAAAGEAPSMSRCHCPSCRRFHSSAFATFVPVQSALEDWGLGDKVILHKETCAALGPVQRVLCGNCSTKLATIPLGDNSKNVRAVLALGAVDDDSIPKALAKRWQTDFQDWGLESGAPWWKATPTPCASVRRVEASGGCACDNCRFKAKLFPGEAQHCYCNLCRRLSGAAAMTWVPSDADGFQWTKKESLRLVRTTGQGQRHMCTRCGGVLTIVYDSQPDQVWPVAGVLDDESLPEDLSTSWYRVIHICCSMMQPWYRLPDDGLARLRGPG